MSRLDGSVRTQVKKAIDKVSQNRAAHFGGGLGEPLANRQCRDLSGLYKIKLRSIGIRVVYALMEVDGVMLIVVGHKRQKVVYQLLKITKKDPGYMNLYPRTLKTQLSRRRCFT